MIKTTEDKFLVPFSSSLSNFVETFRTKYPFTRRPLSEYASNLRYRDPRVSTLNLKTNNVMSMKERKQLKLAYLTIQAH